MVDFVTQIQQSIDKIESNVNEIVWHEAEKDMKKIMIDSCSDMTKILTAVIEMLNHDKERATKKILTECNSIDDLMYNRGRLAQIKKMVEH